ncbi:CLIP1 [Symbiodinium sp. CCMP2592]|nr:CLIP1 [Symbiodinium sp. CCMP2592]
MTAEVAADAKDVETLCALAYLESRTGQGTEAKQNSSSWMAQAMKADPTHPAVLCRAADHSFSCGLQEARAGKALPDAWKLAKKLLDRALENSDVPQVVAEVRYQLGRMEHALGRFSEARELYKQCVQINPDHLAGVYVFAQCLVHERYFSQAVTVLEKAPPQLRKEPQVKKLLTAAYLATGEHDKQAGGQGSDDALKAQAQALPALSTRIVFTLAGQTLEGKVGFAGETEFAPGNWVGVILDGPYGKNDGSVKDKQYFNCAPQHGLFVRPQNIVQATDANGRILLRRKSLASGKLGSGHDVKRESVAVTGSSTPKRGSLAVNPLQELLEMQSEKAAQDRRVSQMTSELDAARRASTAALDEVHQLMHAMQSGREECKTSLQDAQLASERQCSEMLDKLEKSEETAAEAMKTSDHFAAALRKAEEDLKAKSEALSTADAELHRQEVAQAEMTKLRQELSVEQQLSFSKAEEVSRLENSLRQERQRCESLQEDWRNAQSMADTARAELLQASRAHFEQAKDVEAMSVKAARRHSEFLQEVQELRDELSEERRKLRAKEDEDSKSRRASPKLAAYPSRAALIRPCLGACQYFEYIVWRGSSGSPRLLRTLVVTCKRSESRSKKKLSQRCEAGQGRKEGTSKRRVFRRRTSILSLSLSSPCDITTSILLLSSLALAGAGGPWQLLPLLSPPPCQTPIRLHTPLPHSDCQVVFSGFSEFFLSHMCCSRGTSHAALIPAEDESRQAQGIRLDGGEGPIRAG